MHALRDSLDVRAWFGFAAGATLPIAGFYAVYAFPDSRFILPLTTALIVTAALPGGLIAEWLLGRRRELLLLLPLLLAVVFRFRHPLPVPDNLRAAEAMRSSTPADALIVTTGNLAYLESALLRGMRRRLVPLSRRLEYASKVVAWKKVSDPQPAPLFAGDHMCQGLLNAGAEYGIKHTGADVDWLADEAGRGTQLFLDLSLTTPADHSVLEGLRGRFTSESVAPGLFRLRLEQGAAARGDAAG